MRCKLNDMAIIVNSIAGNEGKIIRVIEYMGQAYQDMRDGVEYGHMWRADRDIVSYDGTADPFIFDHQLRPIRDQPGQDQTLQWADVPHKETA